MEGSRRRPKAIIQALIRTAQRDDVRLFTHVDLSPLNLGNHLDFVFSIAIGRQKQAAIAFLAGNDLNEVRQVLFANPLP